MQTMYIKSPEVDSEDDLALKGHVLSLFDTDDEKFHQFLRYQITEAVQSYGVEELILLSPKKGLKQMLKDDFPELEIDEKEA